MMTRNKGVEKMLKYTCKYCMVATNNREACAKCREKIEIIQRIKKMLNN